jgi:hypothetical protein
LQIQQGSTLEGLDLIIFNNFVSSAAWAQGAQPGIILNFVFYYAATSITSTTSTSSST